GKALRGVEASKYGWVSFKKRKGLFKTFEESVHGFKEKYYGIRPITTTGWKSIVRCGPRKDEDGNVVMGPQGVPEE
ncbi:hypothetical protein A2U01_0100793, partial [Trifolium medium]|nr:hypothetical protein [Trifolium medium]